MNVLAIPKGPSHPIFPLLTNPVFHGKDKFEPLLPRQHDQKWITCRFKRKLDCSLLLRGNQRGDGDGRNAADF